jgi:hypothetical protein
LILKNYLKENALIHLLIGQVRYFLRSRLRVNQKYQKELMIMMDFQAVKTLTKATNTATITMSKMKETIFKFK